MSGNFQVRRLGEARVDAPDGGAFFIGEHASVLVDAVLSAPGKAPDPEMAFEQAGPRARLFFDPSNTRAAVVTCGGLCPGLNDVVRGITMVLWYRYGVRDVLGLRYGYEGLSRAHGHEPLVLDPEAVEDIHQHGGTILGTSRGPQDIEKMVDYLVEERIDLLFTIGGDGTQRGALAIADEIERRALQVAVVGVPKTIDNDILFTERTFGFETAVAKSQAPIDAAHMEAKGVQNGIGLVKLMGRESGFVAAYAALASSDVNLVLVPEVPFTLDRVFAYLEARLAAKSHAVIVAAEGAGQELVPAEGTDASGNHRLGDIGPFLKQAIGAHFSGGRTHAAVKYIDPSYTIRSAPADADDSVYCFRLAEHAVHAAMAGRTATVVGLWNGQFVHVPMAKAVASRKRIDPNGSLWQSVLYNTGQPTSLA